MIDLHCHSCYSDGTLSPEEVITEALSIGLFAVAVTDHDTVNGIEIAIEAAIGKSINFVPGVEISAEIETGALHIVGLFINHKSPELLEMLSFAEQERKKRNIKIVNRLRTIGISITTEEVEEEASPGIIGRPHFASILLRKGYVGSMEEAFLKYLAKGGAAYIPKTRIPQSEAVSVIRKASGIPIIAHPDQTKRGGSELSALINQLKKHGLLGIETCYSGYSKKDIKKLSGLARKHDLLQSGGSDFHGAIKPSIRLGYGPGNLNVPNEFYDRLVDLKKKLL